MRTGKPAGQEGGFAYLLLLLAVALIGLAAAAAVSLGASMARRDAERELLAIGAEFEQALRSYGGGGPASLQDLLRDPRAPATRRHLRQIYADPLTGRSDWGLVTDAQSRIIGIHSLAEGMPIQRDNFPANWAVFADAQGYRQWVFGLPQAHSALQPAAVRLAAPVTP